MNTWLKVSHRPRSGGMVGSLLLAGVLLAGCGGEDTTTGYVDVPGGDAVPIVVNTPAQIAQVSADDYNDNVNGMITGATLKRWKDDWLNERPAGITGKLVILQVSEGPAGAEYLSSSGLNVFTYLSPSSEWTQTRSNGVINTQSMVPDGASMDALLQKYNIDPINDMIVVAMGQGTTGNAMGQGRVWYALRYWGVDAENLAILNGGNQWLVTDSMTAGDFMAAADSAPGNGIATVKSLASDNTALQATFADLLSVLPGSDSNVLGDGVFIWDARGMNQYSAGEKLELGQSGCATAYCDPAGGFDYMTTFQNSGSRQGHPWGTLQLQFTRMLDSTKGYAYKPKAELAAYLNGETDASGLGMVDATYQLVGAGNAYQDGDTIYTYCETTFRAMITGVTSAVILGKPTRFYDGAMVEWHSLSYLQDATGNYILPMDSPWRTDVKSFFRPADDISKVAQRQIDDPYAPNANAIIKADKAYKTGSSSTGGGSAGGGGLPSNPCGG
ncbi:MAG TPA: sulfurtransferase [Gammaproteobacteria bacterium]